MSENYPNYTNPNDLYNDMNTRNGGGQFDGNGGGQFDGNGMEVPEEYRDYQEEYYYPNNLEYVNDNQNYMSRYYPPNDYVNENEPQSYKVQGENNYSRKLNGYDMFPSKNKSINVNSRQLYDQAGNPVPIDPKPRSKGTVYSSKSSISKGRNEQSQAISTAHTSSSLSSYERHHHSKKKKSTHKERKKLRLEKELRDYKLEKKNELDLKQKQKKIRDKLRRKMEEEEEKKSKKKHSSSTKKCKASHICNQFKTSLPLQGCGLDSCCQNNYPGSSCCHVNQLCGAAGTHCPIKIEPHLKQSKYNVDGVLLDNLNDCHHFCKNVNAPTSVVPHCVGTNPTAMPYPYHCDYILPPCQPAGQYQQISPPCPNVMPVPMVGVPQMMVAPPNHYQEFIHATPENGELRSQTIVCPTPPMEHTATLKREAVCGAPMQAGKLVYAAFPENAHINKMSMNGSIQPSYQVLSQPPNAVYTSVCQPDQTKQAIYDPKELGSLMFPHVSPNNTLTYAERLPENTSTFIPITDQQLNDHTVRNPQCVVAPLQAISQHSVAPLQATPQHAVGPLQAISQHSVAPLQAVSQHSVAPLQATPQHAVGPLQTTSQHAVAPLQAISQHSIAPLQATSQHSVTPLQAISPHTVAPLQAISQHSVAPLEATSQHSVAPFQAISQHSVAPLEATPQHSVVPLQAISQNSVALLEATPQHSVVPLQGISQHSVAPLEATPQHSVVPLPGISQHSVAPLEANLQHTVVPLQANSQHSVVPLQANSQHSVVPLQATSQQSVAPLETTPQPSVVPLQATSQHSVAPLQTTLQHGVAHIPTNVQQEVVHSTMEPQQRVVYSPLNQMPVNGPAPPCSPENVSFVEGNKLQKSNNDMFIQSDSGTKLLHMVNKEVLDSQVDQQSNTVNSDVSQKKILYIKNSMADQPMGTLRPKHENYTLVEENSCSENIAVSPRMHYNIVRAPGSVSSGDYPLPAKEHRNIVVQKINNVCGGKSLVDGLNRKKTDNGSEGGQSVRKVVEYCPSVTHQSMLDKEILYHNQDAFSNYFDKYPRPSEPLKFGVRRCNSRSASSCFECSSFKNDNGPESSREHTVIVRDNQDGRCPTFLQTKHGEEKDFTVFEQGKKIVYVSDDSKKKENDQVTYIVEKESSDGACHPSVYSSPKGGYENIKFKNGSRKLIVEECNAPSVNSRNGLEDPRVMVTPSSNRVMKNGYSVNDFSCCRANTLETPKNCMCGCKLNKDPIKVVEVGHSKETSNTRVPTNVQISSASKYNSTENQMLNSAYSIEKLPRNAATFRRNYSNKSPRKSFKKEFKKIYVVDSLNDSEGKVYSVQKRYDNHQNLRERCPEIPASIYRNTSSDSRNFSPSSFLGDVKNITSNSEHQVFEYRPYTRKSPEQITVDTLLPPNPKPKLQCFSVHGASIPDSKDISCLRNIKPCAIDSEETTLSKSFSYNTDNLKQRIKDENLRLKREVQSLRRAINRGAENENNVSDLSVEEQNFILQHQIRVLGKAIHDFTERLPDSDEGGKLIEELAYQFNCSLDDLQKMNVMLRQKEKMCNTNTYTKGHGVDGDTQLNSINQITIQAADDIKNPKHSFSNDGMNYNDGRPCFAMVDIYRTPIEADDIRHEMALVDDLIGQSQRIIAEATDTLWLTEYSIKTVLDEFFALMEANDERIVEIFRTSQGRQTYMNELKKTVEKHLISLFKTRTTMDKIQEQITNIKANAWNPNRNLPYCSCRPRRDILEDDIIHLMERLHEAGNQACEMREKLLRVELSNLVSRAETIGRRENESVGAGAVGSKNVQKLLDECQMLREKVLYLNHQLHLEKGKQKFESTTDGEQNIIMANTGSAEDSKFKSKFYKEGRVNNKMNGYISGTMLPVAKDNDSIRPKNLNTEIQKKVSDFKTTCDVIEQNLNNIPDYSKEQQGSHNRLIQRMYERLNYFKKTIERIEWGINQSNDLRDVQGLSLDIQDLIQEIAQQDFDMDNNTSEDSFYTPSDCFKEKTYSKKLGGY